MLTRGQYRRRHCCCIRRPDPRRVRLSIAATRPRLHRRYHSWAVGARQSEGRARACVERVVVDGMQHHHTAARTCNGPNIAAAATARRYRAIRERVDRFRSEQRKLSQRSAQDSGRGASADQDDVPNQIDQAGGDCANCRRRLLFRCSWASLYPPLHPAREVTDGVGGPHLLELAPCWAHADIHLQKNKQ